MFISAVCLSLFYYMNVFVVLAVCIGMSISLHTHEFVGSISPITPDIMHQMNYSWKENNPVPLSELRCVTISYYNFVGDVQQGSLVVHAKVAEEMIDIFREIFEDHFPIEEIAFVDKYQGVDEVSAAANNTYAFCSRPITGTTNTFSKHSYGLAIDINPLYNPYQRGSLIVPALGELYLNRSLDVQGMIHPGSVCHKAFAKRGWSWGGDWQLTSGVVDFQHFEKDLAVILNVEPL